MIELKNIKTEKELQQRVKDEVSKYTDTITKRILMELKCEENFDYIKSECVDGYDTQLANSINIDIFSYLANNYKK